jgi:Ca-activated chloride channel family protein
MSFLWPNMLWLLFLVPAFAALYLVLLRRKRAATIRYGNLGLVREAALQARGFRRHVPALLMLFAIAVLLLAVARLATEIVLPSQRGTVILAMDISGSMRADDIRPSRLEASRTAARAFVEQQPRNVRIGIVAFAGGAALVQPPTLDREDVVAAIDRFQTQLGTAVGSGILASVAAVFEDFQLDVDVPEIPPSRAFGMGGGGGPDAGIPEVRLPDPALPGSYQSGVIVLLTDGQTTQGPDPLAAAQIAADLGVRVYTVGLGTEEGAILNFFGRSMRVQLDEEALQIIADRTRGQYFRADSETDLEEIYRSLSTQLVLEREKTEITALFAALGATAMAAAGLLSMLWFHRVA